jgi:hypothetical protein
MNKEDFKALNEREKVELINERLQELKKNGQTTKMFKSENLDFSYAFAMKEMETLGYARNGNSFEKEVKLTESEIRELKNLAYGYEFVMKRTEYQPRVIRRANDNVTTTSVRMYNKVWKRWQAFAGEWSIYNSVDLMATALEEYMDRHTFEDFETLVEQGKIKEDK